MGLFCWAESATAESGEEEEADNAGPPLCYTAQTTPHAHARTTGHAGPTVSDKKASPGARDVIYLGCAE